jgi:NADH:ubiquinone oxidoreductase subunit 2 (subunit N)
MISVYYYIKLIKILFFELNDNFVQFLIPGRLLSYIIVLSGFLNIFFMLFANLFFTEILNIVLYLL